ncbi:MAG: ATP-binding cassette domain-containing protein, partial [Rhodospirillales bacterium]
MSESASRAWLGPFLAPLRPVFMEILAMSAFVNLLALAVPVFTLQVYDRVIGSGGISTLEGLLIGMIIVLIFDYILRQARSRITQRVALRVDVVIGRKLFDKIMSMPLQALEAQPAAYWTSLFRDVDAVRNTLSGASAILIVDLPFAFFFLGLIFIIALPVAWILLIILPIFMYIAWRSASVMAAASADERQSSQTRDSLVAEIIAGRTTIKALALDNAMRPMWEDAHAENIERALYRGSKTDGYSNFGATLSLITTLLLTTVGALAIIDQKLTMGALIATNMLSGRIMGPMNQLVSQWRTYTGFQQSVDKLGTLFNAAGERLESALKLERPNGEIDIEAVSFAYAPGGKPVVNDISLTIKAGGVHALVGRNGSGKSTLLKIIQGLYRPSKGRVLLDGADISQFTRTELAGWMGYVPQDSILFTGTIRDNVVLRKPDADDDEVLKAAEEAGVHQFVIDLPDGYATDIGESGANLSGGQRQRIAIARALVGDPPVLILDEPSSSLDRQAEQELRRTLVEIGRDRTVIIVTHSPILLAACNDLIALDRGKVALAGPAQDILPKLFGTAPRRPEGDHAAPKPVPAPSAGGPKPIPQGGPKSMPQGGPKPMPQGGPKPMP